MKDRPEPPGRHFTNVMLHDDSVDVTWQLLQERPEDSYISFKMPTYEQHKAFVYDHPYRVWYLVMDGRSPVGAIYLTRRNEIGVFILSQSRGRGYGTWAIRELIRRFGSELRGKASEYPPNFVANIAPRNYASQILFLKLGFTLAQYTYVLKTPPADSR